MYADIQGVMSGSVKKVSHIASPEVPHIQQRLDPITCNEIHVCDKDNACTPVRIKQCKVSREKNNQ